MFRRLHPDKEKVSVIATCATDTENIKLVDLEVQKTIFKEVLDDAGLG